MHVHPTPCSHHLSARRLPFIIILVGLFMVVEFGAGLLSGSLALIADASHMLSDLIALILTWIALKISHKPATERFSYGAHRAQMLVAFINGLSMLVIAGWIIFEAIERFFTPVPLYGWPVFIVAALGGMINIYAYSVLHSDDNFAVRSATLHVLWDLVGSIGTAIAAILILLTHKPWIDPLLSLVLSFLLLKGTWQIIRDSGHILMEGAPKGIDATRLKADLVRNIASVENVHHVHVWSLTHNHPILTLHVRLKKNTNYEEALHIITRYLKGEYGLYHTTIQLEVGPCVDDEEEKCV